jgi:hypothetical protein
MDLSNGKKSRLFIVLIFIFIFASRLYPFLKFGTGGLGYDTGFYRRYVEVGSTNFFKPASALLEKDAIGTRLILDVLTWLKINTDWALFGSYLLFSLLLGIAIYFLTGKIFGAKIAGLFAMLLFALSPVQWLAYTFMLYKQFWATGLLFISLYFFENFSLLFALFLIFAFISHRTTAFLATPAITIAGAIIAVKMKKIWIITLIIPAVVAAILLNWTAISQLLPALKNGFQNSDLFHLQTGTFIDIGRYFQLSILYVIPAIFGFWLLLKKRTGLSLILFFFTCAAAVFAKFIFYQRVIFYLDLCFIVLAGGAISFTYEKFKKNTLIIPIMCLFFLFVGMELFFTLRYYEPLISGAELNEMLKLRSVENESYVMTYSPKYAPWLYGWAGADKRVISPGLFWDKWNEQQWNIFWTADVAKQKEMLAFYHAPLYIFNLEYDYANDSCFEKFSEMIWKFNCY